MKRTQVLVSPKKVTVTRKPKRVVVVKPKKVTVTRKPKRNINLTSNYASIASQDFGGKI